MTENTSADEVAAASSPAASGDTPEVTDRAAPGPPPPAANQGEDEAAAPGLDVTPAAGTVATDHPQSPSAAPRDEDAELDAVRTAPGAPPDSVLPGTTAPGNAQGVSVPATESAPGTSQQSNIVEGVRASPGAVPGRPEDEVDTRR